MSKIKLVVGPGESSSFSAYYLESFWRKYFDLQVFDPEKKYEQNTLFVAWLNTISPRSWAADMHAQGHKVVVDCLWELPVNETDDYHWITNSNWFWYNESLWWRSLDYHNYTPNKQLNKTALMCMRQRRWFREMIINQFDHCLENFIWSYDLKHLPNDADLDDPNYQRFFNPDWYDQTWMSIVVESNVLPERRGFLSEKTYKPMAYYHPFVIVGSAGMLDTVRSQGFETFDNLFDESYDQIKSFQQRLSAIIKVVDSVSVDHYDHLTQQKLAHNHNHFFNQDLVEQRIFKEIVEPLLHYAETR